ncbi:FkbM family methyltransferase [Chitinophaga sp. XS-30]|uniref:FkbM family methyltransferase n=1 Tax=Chitinophaga sp. XS-30 TaxID=2604421 RepID=UPI0011DD1CD9|nr:FkbM family methyltransferase [Chitinophaga sp. XS-30]QEH42579.1 FkbM family methyltransferase [Chitinophaga sp. XS-30]
MKDKAYYPSWTNLAKYGKYLGYFSEYIRYADWKSLRASLRFVFFNKPTHECWDATSALGKFRIRSGTTDFQFVNYAYEKKIRDYLKRETDNGNLDVFMDIGACIGEYSIWLARKGVKCIAFEPVNYEAIHTNISLNELGDRITVFNCGLGSKTENVKFNIMQTVTSSSYIDRESGEGDIRIERLDDLISRIQLEPAGNIIVKLDVEGMETEVLEGARNFISEAANLRIIFERYENDNTVNDKLASLGDFTFQALDEYNCLATKVKSP